LRWSIDVRWSVVRGPCPWLVVMRPRPLFACLEPSRRQRTKNYAALPRSRRQSSSALRLSVNLRLAVPESQAMRADRWHDARQHGIAHWSGRHRADVNDLLWRWRSQAKFLPGVGVNPLRVHQRRLIQSELAVPVLQRRSLVFELLNLITVPKTLEMLRGAKQTKEEDQNAQSKDTVALTALFRVNLAVSPRVVDLLHKVDVRDGSSPSCSTFEVARAPSGSW
jgi:hypothetical protein